VLSPDGRQVQGWATSASVLQALGRQLSGSHDDATRAQAAADWDHDDSLGMLTRPPAPLPGYQVIEITITDTSPAAGRTLAETAWPPASIPVSVLHGQRLRAHDPGITLIPGDRVSLLIPDGTASPHPGSESPSPAASLDGGA
jgi:hypothetical protein